MSSSFEEQKDNAKQILERLDHDLREAIWCDALFRRVQQHDDVSESFGNSYETWGLIYSHRALFFNLTMALSRIIGGETDRESTASLIKLNEIVKCDEFGEYLKKEQLNAINGLTINDMIFTSERSKEEKEHLCQSFNEYDRSVFLEKFDDNLREIRSLFEKTKGMCGYGVLKNFRDSKLAHSSVSLSPRKGMPSLKYQHVTDTLDAVTKIISQSNLFIFRTWRGYEDTKQHADKCADLYWKKVICAANQ